MSDPSFRPVTSIDEDLDTCRAMRSDATAQLAQVRRRLAELTEHELTLIADIEARSRRLDRLLDARLLTAAVGAGDTSRRQVG